jgi:hypothetical protein
MGLDDLQPLIHHGGRMDAYFFPMDQFG